MIPHLPLTQVWPCVVISASVADLQCEASVGTLVGEVKDKLKHYSRFNNFTEISKLQAKISITVFGHEGVYICLPKDMLIFSILQDVKRPGKLLKLLFCIWKSWFGFVLDVVAGSI